MKNRRRIKVIPDLPTLNITEFHKLTDILFETLKENNRACARILGISSVTWKKWNTAPPEWPYWNIVLRHVLKGLIPQIEGNRGFSKNHRKKLVQALSELGHEDSLIEFIEDNSYQVAASVSHLRQLLIRKGMYKDEIMTTANLGGFSHKTIERAAKTLEIVKTQKGFGTHKRSYWRLPNEDDD